MFPFYGNKDIKILEEMAKITFQGRLNFTLIITNEDEIPMTKILDYDGIQKFANDLTTDEKTAPELIKALKVAFTQKDKTGVAIEPVVMVWGSKVDSSTDAFYLAMEKALAEDTNYFYGIGFTFDEPKAQEWAVKYPKKIMTYHTTKTNAEIPAERKGFIRVYYEPDITRYPHIANMIQMLCQYKFAGIKFRELTGVQPYQYTDGEVADFDSKGLAVYREVNGYGEVSNSLCTNQEHEDSRVIMDHVVYNLANNLNIMFRNENVNTKTARNLIDFYSTAAMDYLKDDLLMVEEYLNKIPPITARVRTTRELKGIVWEFVPLTPIEMIEGTATSVTEITSDDLQTTTLGGTA